MDVSRDISFIKTFRMAGRPLGNGVPDNVVPDNMAQHKLRIVRTLMEYGMSRYGAEKLAEEVIAAAKSSAAGAGPSSPVTISKTPEKYPGSIPYTGSLLRVTVTYSPAGVSAIRSIPYARPVIKALRVIAADGIDYHLKFADRSPFDRLQALCRPGETALLTVGDLITDTTFTNIVCEDSSGALLTPASPLLQGTMRQHLLDSGLLRKADIRPEDLPGFTRIHLINAMNGLGDLTVAANSISHT